MQAVTTTPIKQKITSNQLEPGSARDMDNVGELERWASVIGAARSLFAGCASNRSRVSPSRSSAAD